MSRLLYVCLTILFLFSLGIAQDINGKWKGTMQNPNGAMDLTFNFNVTADSLTGSVESQMGELPISNGKVNGKTFTFDVSVGEMTINHQCTAMGDSISMKVPGMPGGEASEIMLKRVVEQK
jgi:hypothetical protein